MRTVRALLVATALALLGALFMVSSNQEVARVSGWTMGIGNFMTLMFIALKIVPTLCSPTMDVDVPTFSPSGPTTRL